MKNENLTEYMKKINIKNKEIAEYQDLTTGNMYVLPTAQLIVKVEKLELTKEEMDVAIFKGLIERKEYNKIDINRKVPKNEITKNDKDKYTLIDKKIKAYELWNVTNGLGIKESFITMEEAINMYKEITEKIVKEYF